MTKKINKVYRNGNQYEFKDSDAHASIDIIVDELNKLEIPDKTSDLVNDSGFITDAPLKKYLPLSGGTMSGHILLGGTGETAFKKVEAVRKTGDVANGAAFYVNSDGTAAFFHKAYSGASATNDAILRFDATGLSFAKGGTRGTNATEYHNVLTDDSLKTINGESIIGEGDIEIEGATYTAGDGIYISDENVISTNPFKPYTVTADTYVALCDADGNWTVRYYNWKIDDWSISYDDNIVSAEIGSGIKSLGIGNFSNLSNLTSIVIPRSVETIPAYGFQSLPTEGTLYCDEAWFNSLSTTKKYNLGNVANWTRKPLEMSLDERLAEKQDKLIDGVNIKTVCGKYLLGSGNVDLYSAGEGIYIDNYKISTKRYTVTADTYVMRYIPNATTKYQIAYFDDGIIPDGSFMELSGNEIVIGDGITSIGNYAFQNIYSLNSLVIGKSVTSIGESAFNSCINLRSVTIPSSVTSIMVDAFKDVPTEGTLYCDEDWFNNLTDEQKTNLGNIANWTRKPLSKTIEERVDELEESKQDVLVSGTNIKTINNQSILGEGNIEIQGGGSSNIINLTQAEYDALEEKDPNTIYNITDATDIDVYTKSEIDNKYYTKSDVYTKNEIDNKIGDIETLLSKI